MFCPWKFFLSGNGPLSILHVKHNDSLPLILGFQADLVVQTRLEYPK
jgi:hypothetical protein